MRNMFKDLFQRSGYKYDYQYDWVVLGDKKEQSEMKMSDYPNYISKET